MLGDPPTERSWFLELSDREIPTWQPSPTGFADVFGRPIGHVGPVTEDYLCYQDRGDLVTLDPETGKELWRRSQLPIGSHVVGNRDEVVVFHPELPNVNVYSPFDGRLFRKWRRKESFDTDHELIAVNETIAIWIEKVGQRQLLKAVNLSNGEELWEADCPTGSQWVNFNASGFGVVSPQGDDRWILRLFDWQKGTEIGRHELAGPTKLKNIHTFENGRGRFLILSGQVDAPELLTTNQIRDGHLRPEVKGMLHAFNHTATRHLWELPVKNVGFPLVQARHVPLLTINDHMPKPDASIAVGRLMCVDSRTGAVLHRLEHSMHVYFALDADLSSRSVTLKMHGRQLRFDYSNESNAQRSGQSPNK